jgi:hypothetical protein
VGGGYVVEVQVLHGCCVMCVCVSANMCVCVNMCVCMVCGGGYIVEVQVLYSWCINAWHTHKHTNTYTHTHTLILSSRILVKAAQVQLPSLLICHHSKRQGSYHIHIHTYTHIHIHTYTYSRSLAAFWSKPPKCSSPAF